MANLLFDKQGAVRRPYRNPVWWAEQNSSETERNMLFKFPFGHSNYSDLTTAGATDNLEIGYNIRDGAGAGLFSSFIGIGHDLVPDGTVASKNLVVGANIASTLGAALDEESVVIGFDWLNNNAGEESNFCVMIGSSEDGIVDNGVAIGHGTASAPTALKNNSCVYIGGNAGNTTDGSTLAVGCGTQALNDATLHQGTVAIGNAAGNLLNATQLDNTNNVFIGNTTGQNSDGTFNVFIGSGCGNGTVGNANTNVGRNAGRFGTVDNAIHLGENCDPSPVAGRLCFGDSMEAQTVGVPTLGTAQHITVMWNGVVTQIPTFVAP